MCGRVRLPCRHKGSQQSGLQTSGQSPAKRLVRARRWPGRSAVRRDTDGGAEPGEPPASASYQVTVEDFLTVPGDVDKDRTDGSGQPEELEFVQLANDAADLTNRRE